MTDTSVKIRAKGCASTGITDELASRLYANKGARILAIVELKVEERHEKADGDRKVDLVIDTLEPVVAENPGMEHTVDEQVRRIQRALFMNRQMGEEGQLPLDSTEPTVQEVLAAASAVVDTDDNGDVKGLWSGDPDDVPADQPDENEDTQQADEQNDQEEPDDNPGATVHRPAFSGT
jgi:hypothetical protein